MLYCFLVDVMCMLIRDFFFFFLLMSFDLPSRFELEVLVYYASCLVDSYHVMELYSCR
jgi:hypothetical protein